MSRPARRTARRSLACAPGRSCSLRPGCSTAWTRPATGRVSAPWRRAGRRCTGCGAGAGSRTGRSRPRPRSPPACRPHCTWSPSSPGPPRRSGSRTCTPSWAGAREESTAIAKDHFALSDCAGRAQLRRAVVPSDRRRRPDRWSGRAGRHRRVRGVHAVRGGPHCRLSRREHGSHRHGLTLLTTSTGNAPSLSWLVVPGTQNIDPAMRRWAESRDLDVEPLRAVGASDGSQGGHGIAAAAGSPRRCRISPTTPAGRPRVRPRR